MTKEAKEAILKWVASGDYDPEATRMLVDSYVALVNADIQEKMSDWQVSKCDCPECRDELDDGVIG